jgi:hypothetical protein
MPKPVPGRRRRRQATHSPGIREVASAAHQYGTVATVTSSWNAVV